MEYKELHDEEKKKLDRAEVRHKSISKRLEESREIYARHLESAERKGDAFALYEAYMNDEEDDEEDDDKTEAEPQIAQAIWDDENLGHTQKLIENKAGGISLDEVSLKELAEEIKQNRKLIKALSHFNPSRRQADDRTVQKHFYFAPGDKWIEGNSAKRREQGKRTNSMFKTFQDIFTRHNYRIIPKSEGEFGKIDFDDISLDHVIVDPVRIPDTFLSEFENRDFGLFVPDSKQESARLMDKGKMIGPLKTFFHKHVKPTPRSSWDDADLNYRVLVVENYDPKYDGKIIIPHFDTSEEPGKRRKVMAVYQSAYSARRKTVKMYPGYEKESERLTKIRWQLLQVRKILINIKKDDPYYNQTIDSSRVMLSRAADLLGGLSEDPNKPLERSSARRRPDNVYKAIAFDRLITTTQLTDKRNRPNKGASLVKLLSVCKDLESRLEEVDDTSMAGPEDQNTLNALITNSEIVLASYSDALKGYLETGNKQPFEALKGTLQKLNARPFNLYSTRIIECLTAMRSDNNGNNIEVKTSEARKAYAITRLFCAQKEVEYLIANWNGGSADNIKLLSDVIKRVGDLKFQGFEKLFDDLKNQLEFVQKEATGEVMHKQPRDGLKDIDFEALLHQIQ